MSEKASRKETIANVQGMGTILSLFPEAKWEELQLTDGLKWIVGEA